MILDGCLCSYHEAGHHEAVLEYAAFLNVAVLISLAKTKTDKAITCEQLVYKNAIMYSEAFLFRMAHLHLEDKVHYAHCYNVRKEVDCEGSFRC